ncbi:hypothetical protein [Pseudomonas matsuisoli]|uniref:hypothetical protein n=1 Tax=Pseudomonas matsuisoli TaxID=1515666 RepID=UPI00166C789D|nr:hypothetical protein [Pseudomonas matsuisoli]
MVIDTGLSSCLPYSEGFYGERYMWTEIVSGILGVLVGTFIGHRLGIHRDKRIEFNAAAAPIYERLEQQRISFEAGLYADGIRQHELATISSMLSRCDRRRLNYWFPLYEESLRTCGHYPNGRFELVDACAVLDAIEKLQLLLSHR